MMLIVKLPKDKPPFLGVLIPGDNYGWSKLNQDLILEHKDASYNIILEFTGNKLDLQLVSKDQQIARIYKDIQYDPAKLTSWVHHTKNAKEFNFSHLHLEDGTEKVSRTWDRKVLFVLKFQKYEIITPE